MNLREQGAADLVAIVEDDADGFGWPITVTNPAGTTAELVGLSTDIGQTIDPETGQAVIGRLASVALPTSRLAALALGIPRGIADASMKPWVITFNDIGGNAHTFKVREAMPDAALGIVTCILEKYMP